jgi:hypothetical protein
MKNYPYFFSAILKNYVIFKTEHAVVIMHIMKNQVIHLFENKHGGSPRLPTVEHQDTENAAMEEKI